MRTIVLDNEAVQALASVTHPKHRSVVAHLAGAASRRRRGRDVEVVVPTSVRVEAGWIRSQPGAAPLNRFRVRDHVLDGSAANVAASIVAAGIVSSVPMLMSARRFEVSWLVTSLCSVATRVTWQRSAPRHP